MSAPDSVALRPPTRRCIKIPESAGQVDRSWLNHWFDRISSTPLNLSTEQLQSLSRMVPALMCGEQSAVCTFLLASEHARSVNNLEGEKALSQISLEELHHEQALHLLTQKLPIPSDLHQIQRCAQRFYLSLGRETSWAIHFYQITLLDSAVSIVMHCAEHSDLKASPILAELFSKIKRDEARHSMIGRSFSEFYGIEQGEKNKQRSRIYCGLKDLLKSVEEDFESLGIDTHRMWRKIDRILKP